MPQLLKGSSLALAIFTLIAGSSLALPSVLKASSRGEVDSSITQTSRGQLSGNLGRDSQAVAVNSEEQAQVGGSQSIQLAAGESVDSVSLAGTSESDTEIEADMESEADTASEQEQSAAGLGTDVSINAGAAIQAQASLGLGLVAGDSD